ncbi:alpha/beta hydrolase [Micromonospora sp. HM5-17]|jgi:alpha-beta hydrolase superfamily lysophospholipase|uniref:alpha/beta hydrolase n=1 Tax=Micromonospora sp. HM5-17 TaxID=2487710 RepID=UPI000F47633F|nr:alpha/beta fold hydrolase [Micromonospora sp. HM5-17]ROT34097.1 alpha/beta fold hydrolase [Micromonospora sp. HM5-17]
MPLIPAEPTPPDSIVLIHGMWLTPRSWEQWADRYRHAGFRVLTPAWPGMEEEVEEVRRDPAALADLNITQIVDHYEGIVRSLDKPPIIMGHCFGGAFTQLLLDRGLGAAGVAIDTAPIKGVLPLPMSTVKASLPVLRNPINRHRAVPLPFDQFHHRFTNTMSRDEAERIYHRYAVPAAGNVLFEAALANLNPRTALRVDFGNDRRAPLLLIADGADRVAPPAISKATAGRYRKSTAITGYKEFPGRPHYTLGQAGWEEVADYALTWACQAAKSRRPLPSNP